MKNLNWRKWYANNRVVLQDVFSALLDLQKQSIGADENERTVCRGLFS